MGKSWATLERLSLPTWESRLEAQPCSSHDLSWHFGAGLRQGWIVPCRPSESSLSQLSLTLTFRAPPLVSLVFHAPKSCSRWTQLASV